MAELLSLFRIKNFFLKCREDVILRRIKEKRYSLVPADFVDDRSSSLSRGTIQSILSLLNVSGWK